MRKPIAVSTTICQDRLITTVCCDDGSIWSDGSNGFGWQRHRDIPQDAPMTPRNPSVEVPDDQC